MIFDCVVGNPPYGMRTNYIHLHIFRNALSVCRDRLSFIMPSKPITVQLSGKWYDLFREAVCTRIEVVGKDVFPGQQMDETAVYFCERGVTSDLYDRRLDVDDRLYHLFDKVGHRTFMDRMGAMTPLRITIPVGSKTEEEDFRNVVDRTVEGKYYLNVSRANGSMGARWFSAGLIDEGVKSRSEEVEFCRKYSTKNVIECPSREYGENLKALMLGPVLRYGLWLTQINQSISQSQFRYVPDIDYSRVSCDRELLVACGMTDEEADIVMEYVGSFDFTQDRNRTVRELS